MFARIDGDVMQERERKTPSNWTRWQRSKNHILFSLAIGAMKAVSWLPLSWALFLGVAIGHLGWVVAAGERRKAVRNLAVAFPSLSLRERRQIARKCFASLGRRAAEICCLERLELSSYVEISEDDRAKIDAALAKGRGLLWVTAHFGNWELLAVGLTAHGYDVRPIAKQSYDPRFTDLIDTWRRRHRVRTLWRGRDDLTIEVGRALSEGAVVGLLIDQDTRTRGVFVPYFGQTAWTPSGAAELAQHSESPVLIGFISRRPEGGHVIRVEEPTLVESDDPVTEIFENTSIFTSAIESAVRDAPEEWVWMHERWRTRPDVDDTERRTGDTREKRESGG